MKTRQPASLNEEDIAAVRSWVIHEDAHIIAFNKPSGLSSVRKVIVVPDRIVNLVAG